MTILKPVMIVTEIDSMRVLMTSFLVLFGILEVSHWVQHFTLPLPLLILTGALLAIASNYGKSPGWSFPEQQPPSDPYHDKIPTVEEMNPTPQWPDLPPSASLPETQPTRSISFTIRRPR